MRDFGNEDVGDEMLNSGNAHFVCLGVQKKFVCLGALKKLHLLR